MPVYEKKGRWYCVYYDGPKRVWEPFGPGAKGRSEAELRDLEIKLSKKQGRWQAGVSDTITVNELCQLYLMNRQADISIRTAREIARTLTRHILPKIGEKQIGSVSIRDWDDIQAALVAGGASARTINIYFIYVNKIWKWAASRGYIKDNPWRNRETLKQKKFQIELFSVDEFQRILEVAQEHLAWALEVAYFTGMRTGPSELFALKWSDCDFKENRIRIYASKTDSYRWQYVDADFMARMERKYRESREKGEDSDYVITYEDKPVKSLKKSWKRAKEDAKVTRQIRLYDIRHFYITYALANGAGIMDLANRVGHTTPSMILKVYAHLVEEMKSKQAFEIPRITFPTELKTTRKQAKKSRTVEKTVERKRNGVTLH